MNVAFDRAHVEEVKVLLVEDCAEDADRVHNLLSEARGAMEVRRGLFSLQRADCLVQALELIAREEFGAVLLDLRLPDSDGLQTLAEVRAAAPHVPIVVLTGFDDDGLALRAVQEGAQDCLTKEDLDARLLVRTIRHAVERKRSEVQLIRHAREVESAHEQIGLQAVELHARAAELDRINRELDDFTYIASHDLKEPLRGIRAYCEILLEDYHDRLDDTGRQRLAKLVDLCQRLENLISDLLTYCRVGGVRPADTGIDLGEVVDALLETLGPAINGRDAAVHVQGRLPLVTGDAMLISVALSNLVANGLKFNQSPQPRVEIGCLPTEPPTLYVRDNGIGIAPEHHEAIFTIFRRLHGRNQYDGTGVGLAIVRKIVESHGGRIWVESEPGKGATFFFTLGPGAAKPPAEPVLRPPHWSAASRTHALS